MAEELLEEPKLPEPWLRDTLKDVPAVARGVLHALELAKEDLERWCGGLNEQELNLRVGTVAPVAFQLRHIARSLGRLVTYAEGQLLDEAQLALLKTELDSGATRAELFAEMESAWRDAARRVRQLASANLEEARFVGKKKLPTTLGGLLVHIADHTQRHVGQAITTAKIVIARRA
jgi:DinB family protein